MKIYIIKYNPLLFKSNMSKISHLLVDTVQKNEFYSEKYGLQIIENNNIYQIESKFDTKMEIKRYNNMDILLDYTTYSKNETISQLPINYILSKNWYFEYKLNKQSKLKLIVKCINENVKEMGTDFIPIDLYFEYDDDTLDFNHRFFQEEFNMLLSHVN